MEEDMETCQAECNNKINGQKAYGNRKCFVKLAKSKGSEEMVTMEYPLELLMLSMTIKNMIEDEIVHQSQEIYLPNIDLMPFQKVMEYCRYHYENKSDWIDNPDKVKLPVTEPYKYVPPSFEYEYKPPLAVPEKSEFDLDNMNEWDKSFLDINQRELEDLTNTANFLDIKPLILACCKVIARRITGKTPQEIRELLGIEDDGFTEEERREVEKENAWIDSIQ